jgi:hypothetical protein
MEPFASIVAREVKFYVAHGGQRTQNFAHGKSPHLRGNELETRVLPPCLLVDDVLNFGVHLREWGIEHFILNSVGCLLEPIYKKNGSEWGLYRVSPLIRTGCAAQVPKEDSTTKNSRIPRLTGTSLFWKRKKRQDEGAASKSATYNKCKKSQAQYSN